MFSIEINIVYLILSNIVAPIHSLVELPVVEDNNIATAETAIRSTVNNLFASFKIQNVKHRPKLKQFSTIHNFFVSITLTDRDSLKKIARLTRVDNIDNNTQHFIAQVNEVLNEGDKSNEANDNSNIYVTEYIETFIQKLKQLKEKYVSNNDSNINADILKYLESKETSSVNLSEEDNNSNIASSEPDDKNVLSDIELWQPSGRRVYQGIRTRIKRYPFMASIQFFKKFQCAGSIIENDLVITSASCLQLAWNNRFFRENPAFLSVQVGCDYYEGDGENIAVLEIYFHPQYDPKYLRNNLAILRLTRKIAFRRSHRRIKMIDYDRNPWPMPSNSPKITVIGWGAKDSSNKVYDIYRNKLSYAELDFYLLRDCQEHYSNEFVTEKNFCAGFYSYGSGACNRDAGGPGIVSGILMGVISFGSPICGAADAPTVFTKLGYYSDWIDGIVDQEVPMTKKRTTLIMPKPVVHIFHASTTSRYTPIPDTILPIVVNSRELDSLRLAQDQGFQDFLSTLFGSEEIREYYEKSKAETDEEITEKTNLSENRQEAEISIEHLRENMKTKGSGVKRMPTTVPAPLGVKLVDSNDVHVNKKRMTINFDIETTTEYVKKITALENASNDDKTVEDDIMSLIDNLDLDQILEPTNTSLVENLDINQLLESANASLIDALEIDELLEPVNVSLTTIQPIISEQETVTKDKDLGMKPLEISPTGSCQDTLNVTPTKKKPSENFLFLSEENKNFNIDVNEDEGLSIQMKPIKESTLRQKPNNTIISDTLSETAMFNLISLAIDEEAKKISKKKRYLL